MICDSPVFAGVFRAMSPVASQVFLDVPIEEVQRRDPKGLYKQVSEGKIKSFTGMSDDAPYEPPLNAGGYQMFLSSRFGTRGAVS